jgi:hypothetical protein
VFYIKKKKRLTYILSGKVGRLVVFAGKLTYHTPHITAHHNWLSTYFAQQADYYLYALWSVVCGLWSVLRA